LLQIRNLLNCVFHNVNLGCIQIVLISYKFDIEL
jgi:hypothetical protein